MKIWSSIKRKMTVVIVIYTVVLFLLVHSLRNYFSRLLIVNIEGENNFGDIGTSNIRSINGRKGRPVLLKTSGGLGNQLFQYACAYATARRRNSPLFILKPAETKSVSSGHQENPATLMNGSTREFSLLKFNIPQRKVIKTLKELQKVIGNDSEPFYFNEQDILNDNLPQDQVLFLNDYCESEIFFHPFQNELRQMFTVSDIRSLVSSDSLSRLYKFLRIVKSTDSVSVHIRRGDFANLFDYRLLPFVYYRKAMSLMKEKIPDKNLTFFVFSDDIDYVRRNIKSSSTVGNVLFLSQPNTSSLFDFLLMSKCKHNIIANSSFSWWAAYLNSFKEKIIIAPLPKYRREWYGSLFWTDDRLRNHKENIHSNFAYPKDWNTIDPFSL